MPFDDMRRDGGPERGQHERAINLPPTILWIIGLNVAVQAVLEFVSPSLANTLVRWFGFTPLAYTGEAGADWWSLVAAPITYQFIHGGWMHLGVNMLSLAAFGAPVERTLGPRRFVAFYLSSGLAAALIHFAFNFESPEVVVGASGAISGIFGAVLMLLWQTGRMPRILPVAGVWIAMNVFFGVVGGTPGAGGDQVAWIAHIGGFLYGLAAIRLFLPRLPG